MNEFDSERITFLLEENNYTPALEKSEADVIILNTCAVREKAKNKLYSKIGELKKLKKENPDLIICVGGCTAQNLKEKIIKDFPYVDVVFGTHNISKIVELINKKRTTPNKNICEVYEAGFDYVLSNFKRTFSFKSYVPISIGCNNYCSYCVVPFVRGKEISISQDEIVKTVKELVSQGVLEITLVGQNVNSYGKDLERPINFADLLYEVSEIEGLRRIRFITSHPKDFSSDLLDVISERKNIMPHIHLPLQAGSNKILKAMNRKYTRDSFFELVENIRLKIKDVSITTDIIVGFPGEEREDFEDTLDAVERIRFNRAFTFIYSKREGTKASYLEDPIPLCEKKLWFRELVEVQNRISFEENKKKEGKKYEVLVEGHGSKGLLEGRLEDNSVVNFEGSKNLIGNFSDILITSAKSFYLMGKIIDK